MLIRYVFVELENSRQFTRGATGVCTLYLAGKLGVTNVEVNNAKGHLSLKVELL